MKDNRNRKIATSLTAVAMICSMLCTPAGAAELEYSVTANFNAEQVYYEEFPENYNLKGIPILDIGVGVDVNVVVTSGTYILESQSRPISMSGKLPNGTVYQLTEDSSHVISLVTTNGQLKDNIQVSMTTTPHQYTVTANSGPKGFKDDLGSTSNPTCVVSDQTQTVDGNSKWTTTFEPNDGLTISHLNIRDKLSSKNIVVAENKVVSVGESKIRIAKAADGSITVSCDHAADDIYITALTVDKPEQHQLSVSTDNHVKADIANITVNDGDTKKIEFTPDSGYLLDELTITDGGKTATLGGIKNSVSVNGHSYSISREWTGKVVLSVPAISADVSISATSSDQKAYLMINTDSHVDCNYPELSYLNKSDSYTIRLTSDDDAAIESVKIESETDSVVLHGNEYRFALDGVYYNVNFRSDSMAVLYLSPLPGNLKISVNGRDTKHTITLLAEDGADYEGNSKVYVEDGDNETVVFTPDYDCEIEQLAFTYQGNTYRVDRSDNYIRINGVRCPIVWEANGRVVVTLNDIACDITIKAYTDYEAENQDYVLIFDTDGGAEVSGAEKVYVDSGSNRSVTFKPLGSHTINELVFTRNGRTYHAERGDRSISIGGVSHSITWYNNGNVTVTLRDITADMRIFADTSYDGYNTNKTFTLTRNPDSHSNISVTPNSTVFYDGQPVSVTITPDYNYTLNRVTLKFGSSTTILRPTTSSFVYNGITYQVSTSPNGIMNIYFPRLPADLTITTITDQITPPQQGTGVHPTGTYHPAYISGIGQGLFAPQRTTTRAEAIVMLTRAFYGTTSGYVATNGTSPFIDVSSNAWYADYIIHAYNQGILSGLHGVGSYFRPNDPITRAEFTELACRYSGIVPTGNYGSTFWDVPTSHWSFSSIGYAASNGWIFGYGNGRFEPDKTITRAELVAITNRVTGRNADRAYLANISQGLTTFADVPRTFWAYYDIIEAANDHYCSYFMGSETWNIY